MMTETEYWFLNLVVRLRWPLREMAASNLEEKVNGPGHGLDRRGIVDTLGPLFRRGWLYASDAARENFVPGDAEIEAALRGGLRIYFGLTALGGREWEALSRPDWNRFVDESAGDPPAEYAGSDADIFAVEIIASSRQRAEEYASLQGFGPAIDNTQVWDQLSPWEATYWKTLPLGHRLRFLSTWQPGFVSEVPGHYEARGEDPYAWCIHPFGGQQA